jgi:hypothetical protein
VSSDPFSVAYVKTVTPDTELPTNVHHRFPAEQQIRNPCDSAVGTLFLGTHSHVIFAHRADSGYLFARFPCQGRRAAAAQQTQDISGRLCRMLGRRKSNPQYFRARMQIADRQVLALR